MIGCAVRRGIHSSAPDVFAQQRGIMQMHGRHLPSAVRAPVGAAGDVHAELLQDLHDEDGQRHAQPDDLIVVLLVRPTGILGKKITEKV